jgi:hypothetical protein
MKDQYYLRPEGNKIFMCCGKQKCPNVEIIEDDMIQISDDYGNSVKMKKEEAGLLSQAVKQLESTEPSDG